MTITKAFGNVLTRIRKEQGYSSAHHFFKSISGNKNLGLTFMSYWYLEQGKRLPKSWRLEALMAALRIEQDSPKARELVKAYFKSLSGSDKLVEILAVPPPAGADVPGRDLAELATRRALEQLAVNLTLDQWRVLARDRTALICHIFMVSTTGWVTVRELAEATRFKPAALKQTLKTMAAGGLAELDGDKIRSPFDKKMIASLATLPETAAIKAAVRDHLNSWLADSKRLDSKKITVRMTKANLDQYRQHVKKTLDLAQIFSNTEENRQESAVYLIDASIFQMFPRD
ncbi:MAG: helix-turn-helix domain-containing protein [Elusimicrobia bacterium]|nr:helix-turn-helix domain-containing protein [Elusimicrobiota bacterium]